MGPMEPMGPMGLMGLGPMGPGAPVPGPGPGPWRPQAHGPRPMGPMGPMGPMDFTLFAYYFHSIVRVPAKLFPIPLIS